MLGISGQFSSDNLTSSWHSTPSTLSSYRFGALGTVFAPSPTAIGDTAGIQGTADNMIANTRQILYSSAAYQDYRVFLKLVPFPRYVSGDLHPVCQPHSGYFA